MSNSEQPTPSLAAEVAFQEAILEFNRVDYGPERKNNPLYIPCQPVPFTQEGFAYAESFVDPMIDALNSFRNNSGDLGVGISANQIPLAKKKPAPAMFITHYEMDPRVRVHINPTITIINDETFDSKEVCLSGTPEEATVKRFNNFRIIYWDLQGNMHIEEYHLTKESSPETIKRAIILQHEYEHTTGTTCYQSKYNVSNQKAATYTRYDDKSVHVPPLNKEDIQGRPRIHFDNS